MAVLLQIVPTSVQSVLLLLFLILVLYLLVDTYVSYRRLSHIKGPWLASISQLWLFKATIQGRVYLECEEVLRKYGDALPNFHQKSPTDMRLAGSPARIAPNWIVHDDPASMRALSAPRSLFTRGHWFKGMKFDPRVDNLLSMTDEKRHAELRAKLMPGYTGKAVPSLESDIDDRVTDFINVVKSDYIDKDQSMDFARLAQYFTLDSLTQLAFGYPFGFLTKNEDLYCYNASSTAYFPIMELGCNVPFIHKILTSSLMQATVAPKPEDKVGFGAIVGIAHRVVAERFGPDAIHRQDMLGSFVARGVTQQECESESMLQILAGADSTATTVRCTFLYILTNPPVYEKLRSEIRDAVHGGRISSPVVKHAEATELTYLQACIKEGLRMWQPLNGLGTRLSPPEGGTINGVHIPGGVEVGVSQHAMMRRKDLFGQDADFFRPERWIENNPETLRSYERVWDLSFGSGRSSCLGRNIALMELSKIFVEVTAITIALYHCGCEKADPVRIAPTTL